MLDVISSLIATAATAAAALTHTLPAMSYAVMIPSWIKWL
jgi:hypothetical protein